MEPLNSASARACTARLAAPGCRPAPAAQTCLAHRPRLNPSLHAPSWPRRLLAAPVHPARPRSPALDTHAARTRR
jgi:hypothetical protein